MKKVRAIAVLVAASLGFSGCVVETEPDKPVKVGIDVPPSGGSQPQPVVRPQYRILSLKRDPGSDFAYSFEILVLEEAGLNVYAAIQREFRDAVRNDYAAAFAVKDARSIYVDIPDFVPQNDGTVKGRALVISATPVAVMDYDVHTRRGRMTVRFHSAIGTEAARKWARENIEKLARDKNIMLTTGTMPPEGQYFSLGEKWRENTLEIEFRVE